MQVNRLRVGLEGKKKKKKNVLLIEDIDAGTTKIESFFFNKIFRMVGLCDN